MSRKKRDSLPLFFRAIGIGEEDWKDAAACNGADAQVFFGRNDEEFKKGSLKRGPHGSPEAMAYCKRCVVRQECYDYAVRNKEVWGIWGGKDFSKSKRERSKQAKLLRQQAQVDKENLSLNDPLNGIESRK